MKKEIADKWVTALRSGEYHQGRFNLNKNDEKFCCLGVLCEIAIKEGLNVKKTHAAHFVFAYDYEQEMVPSSIRIWAGMRSFCGEIVIGQKKLTILNDSDEYDFNQIADVIEKEWENL